MAKPAVTTKPTEKTTKPTETTTKLTEIQSINPQTTAASSVINSSVTEFGELIRATKMDFISIE